MAQSRRHGRLAVAVSWTVDEIANFKPEKPDDLKIHAGKIKAALSKKNIGCKDRRGGRGRMGEEKPITKRGDVARVRVAAGPHVFTEMQGHPCPNDDDDDGRRRLMTTQ